MRSKRLLLSGCLALALAGSLPAASFSFTGNFTQDNDVQLFNFTVGATSNVTLRTWSYAGGVNAAGATIARGGFDPILAVFNSSGVFINQNDDGGSSVAQDLSGARYDTFLTVNLAAGNYTVAVMQYNNFANGPNLSNGFVRDGQGNFTPSFGGAINATTCPQQRFCDVSGSAQYLQRNGNWAFDILNVNEATTVPRVPEPSTVTLVGAAALALVWRRRRQMAR